MTFVARGIAAACLLGLAGLACSSKSAEPACTPGSVERCACVSGDPGQRICSTSAEFGSCLCPGGPDAAADRPPGPGADLAPPRTDAPEAPACRPRACGTDVLCGSADDGCGGTLSCGPCYERARTLAIPARAIVADRQRQLLYATVAGDVSEHANTIVTIDPATMKVKTALPIGSNPGALALADDGNTLWVAIDGAFAIRRVDLSAQPPTVGPQHALPRADGRDAAWASSITALPGTPLTVAITLNRPGVSPSFGGVAILDDGVPRPVQTRSHTGAESLVAGPAGTIFGSGGSFYLLTLSPTGITQQEFSGVIDYGPLAYADGRVYGSGGAVVDVRNLASPVRVGRFSFAGPMFPEAGKPRAFMFSAPSFGGGNTFSVRWLDTENFVEVRSKPIQNVVGRWFGSFARLGPETFAMLVLADTVPSAPATIAVFETSVGREPGDGGQ